MSELTQNTPAVLPETTPAPLPTNVTAMLSDGTVTIGTLAQTFGLTPMQIAATLAVSGVFGRVSKEEALAKMLVGGALGFDPISSLQNIDVIEGHIFMRGNLRAAKINSTPGYSYKIVEHDNTKCVIEFIKHGELLGRATYTIDDARKAGLVKAGSNWEKSPRNMLFNRCLSNGQKWFMPELMGGKIIYDTDTERDEIRANSKVAAAEITQQVLRQPAEPQTVQTQDGTVIDAQTGEIIDAPPDDIVDPFKLQ